MTTTRQVFFLLSINRLTRRFDYGMEPVAWGHSPELLIEWPKRFRVHSFYDTAYRITRHYDPKSPLFDFGLHYEVSELWTMEEFLNHCRDKDIAREIYTEGFLKLIPVLN